MEQKKILKYFIFLLISYISFICNVFASLNTTISYNLDTDGIDNENIYAIGISAGTNSTRLYTMARTTNNNTLGQTNSTTTTSKATLTLNTSSTADKQLWVLISDGTTDGYYIQSLSDGLYLNITSNGFTNSFSMTSTKQSFTFTKNNNYYRISTKINNRTYYIYRNTNNNSNYSVSTRTANLYIYRRTITIEGNPTKASTTFKGSTSTNPFTSDIGAAYYSKPSLTKLNDGTIIAVADAHWTNNNESPSNIDTIFSYSKDNGATWNYEIINYFSDYNNSSSTSASASYSSSNVITTEDKAYMITDLFPAYTGLNSTNMGTESTGFDSNGYLLLAKTNDQAPTTLSSYTYYINLNETPTEFNFDGTIINLRNIRTNGNTTGYYIDDEFNLYQTQSNQIIPCYISQPNNNNYYTNTNIFYNNSEFKVYPTSYLAYKEISITDSGLTSTKLRLLNVKNSASETLLSASSGNGIYNNGRLIYTIYSSNYVSTIYSDDNGTTWHRSNNINATGTDTSIISLTNGNLRMYIKNNNQTVYVDSIDNGSSWGSINTETNITSNNNYKVQTTRITGTIRANDKTYNNIVVSTYAKDDGPQNGIIRIGTIKDSTITYLNEETTYYNSYFGLSDMIDLSDTNQGSIGLLYEDSNGTIKFTIIKINDLLPSDSGYSPYNIKYSSSTSVAVNTFTIGDISFRLLGTAAENELNITDTKSIIIKHSQSDTCTNHLVYDETDDNNLRFIGSNPCNYVTYNNEQWRIIGIMNNVSDGTTAETRYKLIRAESLGTYSWDSSNWNTSSGYGINSWNEADLASELNGDYLNTSLTANTTWYNGYLNQKTGTFNVANVLTTEAQNQISDVVWNLGNNTSTTLDDYTPAKFYTTERGTNTKLSTRGDSITRQNTWTGKVALPYPSDYGFATEGGETVNRDTCLSYSLLTTTALTDWSASPDCYQNNWLYNSGTAKWTLTAKATTGTRNSYVFTIYTSGNIDSIYAARPTQTGYSNVETYPVVYLNSDIAITSGDGSEDNPYIISSATAYTITYSGVEEETENTEENAALRTVGSTETTDNLNNPTIYYKTSEDITLNNPTRDGYEFLGWTGTGLEFATINVTIPKGSTGNREYTANWRKIESSLGYDVIRRNQNITELFKTNTTDNQTFNSISTIEDTGVYSLNDPFNTDTTLYYYRGNITNNYVSFNGLTWRILRLNGDHSIRLILDDSIGDTTYNNQEETSNIAKWEDSLLYTNLHTWYDNTITENNTKYIVDSTFIKDYNSELDTETNIYNYGSSKRLLNQIPTLNPENSEIITDKIGTISTDELIYAGALFNTNNEEYFLKTTYKYWTMSPLTYDGKLNLAIVDENGMLTSTTNTDTIGLRPVITISGDYEMTGTGTSTDPFKYVEEEYDE